MVKGDGGGEVEEGVVEWSWGGVGRYKEFYLGYLRRDGKYGSLGIIFGLGMFGVFF